MLDRSNIEFAPFGRSIRKLAASEAASTYAFVSRFDSPLHYGLNDKLVENIERLNFGYDDERATDWIAKRVPSDAEVLIAYGDTEVYACSSQFFVETWRLLFVPARDDAIVWSSGTRFIMFVCHENELEAGSISRACFEGLGE